MQRFEGQVFGIQLETCLLVYLSLAADYKIQAILALLLPAPTWCRGARPLPQLS